MHIDTERPHASALELHDLAKASPQTVALNRAHDAEILQFFDNAGMGGKIRLLMRRRPHFWDLFDQRGGVSRALGMRDYEGRLIGTGSLTSTPCFIAGQEGRFGYMSDLRIQTRDKSLRLVWRDLFARILQYGPTLKELGERGRLLCVIIESNARAIKVLKESVHNGQRLVNIAPYAMITLFKRLPRPRRRSTEFSVSQQTSVEELETFLDSVQRPQAFGQCFLGPHFELRRRLKEWVGFSLGDFYVVRDCSGRMVGCTGLWNPNHCKQSVIEGPWWTRIYNMFAHALRLPRFGRPLEIVYLTHLSFAWDLSAEQKAEAMAQLMDALWPEKRKRRAEGLAFCDFKEFSLAGQLKGYLKVPVHVGLYTVMPEKEVAGFDRNSLGLFPPAFELALV
ncbi:MAG: hypothetical protein KF799_10255 [Bdellovibrionales bacterium]|nr:hypothetical protein [Bdellovibrionales bacterium]